MTSSDGDFAPAGRRSADPAQGSADPAQECLFEARLVPYRSLSRNAFRTVMGVFALASLASGIPFVLLGAWPVAGFLGLDVAILYLAFRANFHAARAYEDILVTPVELVLAKVTPAGARAEWRFPPAWVRLDRQEHEEFGIQRLSLCFRGRSVEIARFLGPDEKARFASRLVRALSQARRGPRFS